MNDQQRAAMRCALEALEEAHTVIEHRQDVRKREEAITALREALAQPQGEWVDLTDDDISDTYAIWWRQKHVFGSFTHAAIAKFKEKNTPPVVPQGEPVATKQMPDPYDYRDGIWFDAEGLKRLRTLPPGTQLYTTTPSVEAAIDWSNLDFQCHALQQIGAHWYDGRVRNQWIADTCHEMKKHIAAAIRSMR